MRFLPLLALLLLTLFILSCSGSNPLTIEEEDPLPPEFATISDYTFTFPGEYPPENYTAVEVEYQDEMVTGYLLEQFVPIDLNGENRQDLRPLYAYEIVGDDGFTHRMRMDEDLNWSLFSNGHLLPDKDHRTYISDDPALRPYNVKFAHQINLYRKVDVIMNENDPVMFEVLGLESVDIETTQGTVAAIPMSSFISNYITLTPENFQYKLVDINNEVYELSWTAFSGGYWLIDDETVIYQLTGDESLLISLLMRIELHDR